LTKVFIVNQSCHDLSEAEKFGEITIMTSGYYTQLATGKMFRAFSKALADSNPEDYIVPCGRRIMSNVACAMFAARHKRLNLLIWIPTRNVEVSSGRYKERLIIMEDRHGADQPHKREEKSSARNMDATREHNDVTKFSERKGLDNSPRRKVS